MSAVIGKIATLAVARRTRHSGHRVTSCAVRLLRRPVLVRRHPQDWLRPDS